MLTPQPLQADILPSTRSNLSRGSSRSKLGSGELNINKSLDDPNHCGRGHRPNSGHSNHLLQAFISVSFRLRAHRGDQSSLQSDRRNNERNATSAKSVLKVCDFLLFQVPLSSFSPDSKSRVGRGDQSLILKLSVFWLFVCVGLPVYLC